MAKTLPPRQVLCYFCHHVFEVGGRTMSIPCPKCHKALVVEDVVVKTYKPVKTLQTCGKLIIRKGGRVTATDVEAHLGVECSGALTANVVSGGPVRIGPKGEWKGNLRAPSVQIKAGARILGGRFEIPNDPFSQYRPAPSEDRQTAPTNEPKPD